MPEKKAALPPLFTPQFLARLETLRVRTRRRFLGSRPGGHLSLRRGSGLEFADYRPYTLGDDPRYIDWKLYSRTDRLYIKLFQEEEDLYTYLFLDLSASMGWRREARMAGYRPKMTPTSSATPKARGILSGASSAIP